MADRQLLILFGATGDLYHRKLLPALRRLITSYRLEDQCAILGVATSELSEAEFQQMSKEALAEAGLAGPDDERWCERVLRYQRVGRDPESYRALRDRIEKLEAEYGYGGNRVFYLALPPSAFEPVIRALGEVGLNHSSGWTRLVIEKPFGRDLGSAEQLNEIVHAHFDESQVYRIDHYLGKQTVQNLLVFRFANQLFESAWTRDLVDNVQITVAEDIGIGTRARYYEQAGALRDMVQNHLTQVMALVAMEPPSRFDAEAIRNEKVKVLQSMRTISFDDVVLGQYAHGAIAGEAVPGYRDEEGVDSDSHTPTFAGMRVFIDNWRWQGVPFYLRTGKRLPARLTQIAVTFKEPPVSLFERYQRGQRHSNVLLITLQPDEGFELLFDVKAPTDTPRLETLPLRFRYSEAFGAVPDAYETLLFDVLTGDQTLFVRADEVEESWRMYTPLLESDLPVIPYRSGTWGPQDALRLPYPQGDHWTVRYR